MANTTYAYYLRMYDHNIRKTLPICIAQGARLFIYFLKKCLVFLPEPASVRAELG